MSIDVKIVPADVQDAVEKATRYCELHAGPGTSFSYAVSYLKALDFSLMTYGVDGYKTQLLYVLCNLGSWRGTEAQEAKKVMSRFAESA